MILEADYLARVSCPGQFVMLQIPKVFLKRPVSIASASQGEIELIYKVVGAGTKSLSSLKPGSRIDVLGPLGNGYNLKTAAGCQPLLVGGGTGIASLAFLASKLPKPGVVFYGASSKEHVIIPGSFAKSGWKVMIATDNGSTGRKGFVTDIFRDFIASEETVKRIVYTCGPKIMQSKLAKICDEFAINGYASLEEMMACGTGICQGCAVKISGTYKTSCSDGPIFAIKDIDW